nr:MAG TPA: hypothetical protein [Caudoviricetes sp.]
MRKQTFQHAEIRDENDNIISAGAYGKNTALSNKQNDGWVDYVMNNLERLQESIEDNAKSNDSTNQKLTDYAKTAEVDNKLTNYAKKESLIGLASTEYVDGRFTHLIGASAEALDTLEEIGKSLKNDADFAGTMTKELAKRADKATVENALMGKAEKANVYTKQKVDEKINEYEKKQTLKKINATINTDYVSDFYCYQIGHAVQVSFSIHKSVPNGALDTLITGLPKPVNELFFNSPVQGNIGNSIRFLLKTSGGLKFHYPSSCEISQGKEFQTFFTYLTEDV